MRRSHDSKEAMNAASTLSQSPFTNYSFDLIIGQIHQDLDMLNNDLRLLESFKPPPPFNLSVNGGGKNSFV